MHLPDRERCKGQRHSNVTLSLLLSVPFIFVADVSEFFHIGSLDIGTFYYVYPAVKCRSVATVAKFSDDRLNI